jgi:transcriptional regulator with XRE-family HTH domain
MTLSQRIREYRYSKGWGPDELAGRASISRTALYQIECGRTEAPRAGTLCRIAKALGVGVESLLGAHDAALGQALDHDPEAANAQHPGDWTGPANALDAEVVGRSSEFSHGPRLALSSQDDVRRAFAELLDSPYADTVGRIVTEMHRLLPNTRERNAV